MTPTEAVQILQALDRAPTTSQAKLATMDVVGSVIADLIAAGYFEAPELYQAKRIFQAACRRDLPHQQNRDTGGRVIYPSPLAEGFGNMCVVLRQQRNMPIPQGLLEDIAGSLDLLVETLGGIEPRDTSTNSDAEPQQQATAGQKRGRPTGVSEKTMERYERWAAWRDRGHNCKHIALHLETPPVDPETVRKGSNKFWEYQNKNRT